MPSLWSQVKSIFQQAEASSPSQPAIHEIISREEASLPAYERWKNTFAKRRLLNWLVDQYAVFKTQGRLDEAVDFLDTPSTKGFVVHFSQTQYTKEEATYFFDYLKEVVLGLGYRSQISDRRIFSRSQWVETQERHYLKPRNSFVKDELIEQKFGNITIELELRDDRVRNLRFRATIYKDALYKDANTFPALMMALLA